MSTSSRRGSALLAVLWLSAVLAAIGFSLASTVRGEAERASTAVDTTRGYYLAAGAVQRAILYMLWGTQSGRRLSFPTGEATVEVSRKRPNSISTPPRPRTFSACWKSWAFRRSGPATIAMAIVDWRSPSARPSPFDQHYLSLTPSFRARHASFEEIEELLLVQGMTPDIYLRQLRDRPRRRGRHAPGAARRVAAIASPCSAAPPDST